MTRPEAFETARALIAERYPEALQAWLSGSVVLGGATATSDLDITVLLPEGEAHRTSTRYRHWPVEIFVHTQASIAWYVARDVARRRPTMARLIATGVALLPGAEGSALQEECAAVVATGPGPLTGDALTIARYALTDLLDDLVGSADDQLLDAIVVDVWRSTAELYLAANRAWTGSGKWLVRELRSLDEARGGDMTGRLHAGLRHALAGDIEPLVAVADAVLDEVGGRLWAGLHLASPAASNVLPEPPRPSSR